MPPSIQLATNWIHTSSARPWDLILERNYLGRCQEKFQKGEAQEEALLNLFTGKLGGPVADLVKLIGEVVGVERVPITFE